MLKNNGKMIIGKNLLFCMGLMFLMFTAFGLNIENSFAADVNDTANEIRLESNNVDKLENSQENEVLEVNSQYLIGEPRTPNGDIYKSIQDEVNAAHAGDTIVLKGTYHSNGNDMIYINKQLTITADSMATFDGKHLSIALCIDSGAAGTVLKNLKFINGKGGYGSAVYVNAKNVRIENCIFEDNHANRCGAIRTSDKDLDSASGLIVDNCEFRRNSAYFKNFENETSGAAVSIYGKDSEVKNCIFEDNWVKSRFASFGGAIQIGLDLPGSNSKVTNCIFKNNRAISTEMMSHGGAGCVRQGSSYTNCIFINNSADEGGALTFHSSGVIKNCTFIDNSAEVYGGALSTGFLYTSMDLKVLDCNFYNNTAPKGGAIQAIGLNILVYNSNFKGNNVSECGGSIYVQGEEVTVKSSTFNSNKANINGGAIYIKGKNTIVEDSIFISNEAIPDVNKLEDGLGGAVYVNSSLAYIKDNSFRFNTARNGSAIYYDRFGEKLTLLNNEFSQNQAWVYKLPILVKDIYYEDSEEIKVILFGGNNIADFDNLAVSNAIFNDANNVNIMIDGQYPLNGATDSGELYQDSREYNINVLLTVQHEDGTLVYNEVGHTDYLGEIIVNLDNLKPGKYFVSAKHYEDNYYKGITNDTTFVVKPKVDNEVTKTVSKNNVNFEDVVTWTISIKNHGPNYSTNVKLYDVLPDGLIWINDTSNGKYNHNSGLLTLDKIGVNETFTFDIITVINATGVIVNNVNVTSDEFDENMSNNHVEKSIFVNPAVDLSVVKSVSNSKPNYKDNITWIIKISNNGPDTAHDVKIFDMIPKELIYVDSDGNYDKNTGIWDVGTVESGKILVINIDCIVNGTGLIENSVLANGTEFDYDLTNNEDKEIIHVDAASDLVIEKTVNSSNVNFNDLVKWTLLIYNNGPDNATNVHVVDTLPDGFSYVNSTLTNGKYVDGTFIIDNVNVGEKVIIEIVTLVETTGSVLNIANVTSDEHDFNLTNNVDEKEILVNFSSDLSVVKSVSDSNPNYGDIITWTIEIVNHGPDVAHNITVRDLLPNSLVWMGDDSLMDYDPITGILFIEELDVEEEYVLNIECLVNRTGLIQNNVSVIAHEYDHNLTNNFDNETIDVEKSADVSVVKLVDNSHPNYNDLVKWTIIISNNGPDKATNVYVEDELPEGLILVNYTATKGFYDSGIWTMCCLNKGDTETLQLICRVNKTGNITNFASIHADEYDNNQTNSKDNSTIDVPLAVDLQVNIKSNNTSPIFGDKINWMIVVKNNGPDNATEVVLNDVLPEGLIFYEYESSKGIYADDIWDIGTLNVGNEAYINITTICDALGVIVNNVEVDASEYDWNTLNNYGEDKIDVKPVADLSIIKLVDNNNPKYGQTVKWTLIVSNNGPNTANNVIVKDILPSGLKFIRSNGDYSNNIWNIEKLNVGEKRTLEIICKVIATGNFNNKAEISADELDLNEFDNQADRSIHVAPASDLSITKVASKYNYFAGDMIEYVIEVVNNGPDTARNIKINEILDDLLKLKSFKVTKGKFDKFTKIWTIKSLDYGQSAKLFIKVIAVGSGIIKNKVSVTSDTFDYDKSNNNDFAEVNVTKKPSIESMNLFKSNSNQKVPSNLEMHPTANPLIVLLISCIFSMLFLGNNISKRR